MKITKLLKILLKGIIYSGIMFLAWGIIIIIVLISISGICALLSYLNWEYLLTGVHGIVAFLGITGGSLGLGFLFAFKFVYLFEKILKDSKLLEGVKE